MKFIRLLAVAAFIATAVTVCGTSSAMAQTARPKCQVNRFEATSKSFAFRSVLLKLSMTLSWCYNGKKVTSGTVTCKIEDFDRITIVVEDCQVQTSPQSWGKSPSGALYALVYVRYTNCILKFGCWQSDVKALERWAYGDGIIIDTPRGTKEEL